MIDAPTNYHLRVLAGAGAGTGTGTGTGTGKTTTVCCRIKKLIDSGIHPKNILMLTFNVEACANMKQRLEDMFGFEIDVEIRTIDAFCRKLIFHYKMDSNGDIQFNGNNKIISLAEYALKAVTADLHATNQVTRMPIILSILRLFGMKYVIFNFVNLLLNFLHQEFTHSNQQVLVLKMTSRKIKKKIICVRLINF